VVEVGAVLREKRPHLHHSTGVLRCGQAWSAGSSRIDTELMQ
jgi:hypothetical protein